MVPDDAVRLIHADELDAAQEKEFVARLMRVNCREPGVNNPPTGPLPVKPVEGETESESGTSNASTSPEVVELAGEVALDPKIGRAHV